MVLLSDLDFGADFFLGTAQAGCATRTPEDLVFIIFFLISKLLKINPQRERERERVGAGKSCGGDSEPALRS